MKIPENGELESTILGIILILGSAGFLFLETLPWHAAGAGVLIGVYLMVPNRLKKLADLLKAFKKDNDA